MKTILLFCLFLASFALQAQQPELKAPEGLSGTFSDDYGIKYQISDTVWTQLPKTRFHILRWNTGGQYLIARNNAGNPGEGGLYTRIDYMRFENMEPYRWGFCLTSYNAPDDKAAEAVAIADRKNPRKGCNGFPFSRMKKVN